VHLIFKKSCFSNLWGPSLTWSNVGKTKHECRIFWGRQSSAGTRVCLSSYVAEMSTVRHVAQCTQHSSECDNHCSSDVMMRYHGDTQPATAAQHCCQLRHAACIQRDQCTGRLTAQHCIESFLSRLVTDYNGTRCRSTVVNLTQLHCTIFPVEGLSVFWTSLTFSFQAKGQTGPKHIKSFYYFHCSSHTAVPSPATNTTSRTLTQRLFHVLLRDPNHCQRADNSCDTSSCERVSYLS